MSCTSSGLYILPRALPSELHDTLGWNNYQSILENLAVYKGLFLELPSGHVIVIIIIPKPVIMLFRAWYTWCFCKSQHDCQSRNSLNCCSVKSKFNASCLPRKVDCWLQGLLAFPASVWIGRLFLTSLCLLIRPCLALPADVSLEC